MYGVNSQVRPKLWEKEVLSKQISRQVKDAIRGGMWYRKAGIVDITMGIREWMRESFMWRRF